MMKVLVSQARRCGKSYQRRILSDMLDSPATIQELLERAHSPIRNYVVPGVTSWLIGQPNEKGCIRLFDCSRDQQEAVTPHSHRFDFWCMVLSGQVINRIWTEEAHGDEYAVTSLRYGDRPGAYEKEPLGIRRYLTCDSHYFSGDVYSMSRKQIHSIYFSRGTRVLFFEGPQLSTTSVMLEPYVDGQKIETFKIEPWMFKKEQGS